MRSLKRFVVLLAVVAAAALLFVVSGCGGNKKPLATLTPAEIANTYASYYTIKHGGEISGVTRVERFPWDGDRFVIKAKFTPNATKTRVNDSRMRGDTIEYRYKTFYALEQAALGPEQRITVSGAFYYGYWRSSVTMKFVIVTGREEINEATFRAIKTIGEGLHTIVVKVVNLKRDRGDRPGGRYARRLAYRSIYANVLALDYLDYAVNEFVSRLYGEYKSPPSMTLDGILYLPVQIESIDGVKVS